MEAQALATQGKGHPGEDETGLVKRPWRMALLAFAVTVLVALGVVVKLHLNEVQIRSDAGRSQAGVYAQRLQDRLQSSLSATFALAAVVRQGKGEVVNFDRLAAEMLPLYPGVSVLQLVPNGVISQIYPLAGNEQAVGHDVLNDPLRRREALLAMRTRQLVLAGPFPLVQGGTAVIGRFPVFLPQRDGEEKFWGFTNAIVMIPDLLASAHLDELQVAGYDYQLWRIEPENQQREVFAGFKGELHDPATVSFEVPNGRWSLSVAPVSGWVSGWSLALRLVLALAFSLTLVALYYLSARRIEVLRQQAVGRADEQSYLNTLLVADVDRRQQAQAEADAAHAEIEQAHREWIDAFDAVRSLVFLHDSEFRIMRANRAYLAAAGCTLEQAIGKPYWQVFPKQKKAFKSCCQPGPGGGDTMTEEEFRLDGDHYYSSRAYRVGGKQPYSIHILDDVTERHKMLDQIRRQAHHDALTGLPNRVLFTDRCDQALSLASRQERLVGVMLMDLDGFKPVNDEYGHDVGDCLLQMVAERLLGCLRRRSDTVARLGGDEFVALLPDLHGPEILETVAAAMVEALARPFELPVGAVRISVSIGVACFPSHGETTTELLRRADEAMYRVKKAGRNNYAFAGDLPNHELSQEKNKDDQPPREPGVR